jgi:N-methylhydantoinase A
LNDKVIKHKDRGALRKIFLSEYEERFGRSLGQLPIECVSWRVRIVAAPSVQHIKLERAKEQTGNPKIETRSAYFEEIGRYLDTPVYARAGLKASVKINGPALIEEGEATCVVGPSGKMVVDRRGNLIMKIDYSNSKS